MNAAGAWVTVVLLVIATGSAALFARRALALSDDLLETAKKLAAAERARDEAQGKLGPALAAVAAERERITDLETQIGREEEECRVQNRPGDALARLRARLSAPGGGPAAAPAAGSVPGEGAPAAATGGVRRDA